MLAIALMDKDDASMEEARELCDKWLDRFGPKPIVRQ
jgi:hypothetical protein